MHPNPDVTVFVPTYNRPEFLSRTLRFLQQGPVRLPIIVGDGSDASAAAQNEALCRSLGANIEYFHLPSTDNPEETMKNYLRRWLLALRRVETAYVTCCADDDLLLPEAVIKSVAFLAANPDYVACHGIYLAFRYIENQLKIEGVSYDGPSVDGNEIGSRLMQFYWRYEAPFYAVYRTPVQQSIFERAQDISSHMLLETFHSAAVVIEGKLKRLGDIYCLRNIGVPPHARPVEGWHPWMVKDFDDFFDTYRKHRTKIIEFAFSRSKPGADLSTLQRAIDMAFMIYFSKMGFPMNELVNEYLAIAVKEPREKNRLQQGILTGFSVSFAEQLQEQERIAKQERDRLAAETFHPPVTSQPIPFAIRLRRGIKYSAKVIIRMVFGERGLNFARCLKAAISQTPVRQDALKEEPPPKEHETPAFQLLPSEHGAPLLQVSSALINRFPSTQWDGIRQRMEN